MNSIINLPYDIQKLEQEPLTTTNGLNQYDENEVIPFYYNYDYLYHGIRFQKYLEKLESIFKSRKILAGKYIEGYYSYSDNCNKGEYVSLLKYLGDNNLEYETFIESNISLLITPLCNAIETKYIRYDIWLEIKNASLKNIYSYMRGECFCKDFIDIDYIKAIGVPYQKLKFERNCEYADKLLKDIQELMKQYQIELPIVDTSRYNRILFPQNQENKIRIRKY